MKRWFVAGQIAAVVGASLNAESVPTKPNILFVMVDDLSPKAVGYKAGFDFLKTPNVDRIAAEGAVFDHMLVTTSLCSPSRASMLTGTYAHTHGVRYNETCDPDPALPTFSSRLQREGYRTALIGKWHMAPGSDPRPGFDYWLSFEGQGEYFDPELNENGQIYHAKGYMTDILTEKTLRFIEETPEQPFCVCLWHKANHGPFKPAPRHVDAFPGILPSEPPTWSETMADKPYWMRRERTYRPHYKAWVESEGAPVPDKLPPKEWEGHPWVTEWADHLRCQLAVDESLGRIMDLLRKQGRLNDTIIIFTADNGFFLGEHRRGDKRLAYEESMHIPFCIRYPQKIASGTSVQELCASIDIAPTLLELAGAAVPDSMQGQSFLPLLEGRNVSWRDAFFYEYFQEEFAPGIPTMLAVRTDRWKYIHYPYETTERGDIDELYDLENDPVERHNLIAAPEMRAVRMEMQKKLKAAQHRYDYAEPPYRYEPLKTQHESFSDKIK